MTNSRTLIVGIGSPHGDDQIGWRVVGALRSFAWPAIDVREASTPSQLLDWLDGVDRLIVCDACQARRRASADSADDAPGIHRWQWPTMGVSMLRSADSHSFGLPQVLQLAERLGKLPRDVIVFGIEGRQFDAFAGVSPDVEQSIGAVVGKIAGEPGAGPVTTGQLNVEHLGSGPWEPARQSSEPATLPSSEEASHA